MLDFLDPLIRKAGLEEHLALHLKHLVLSHHGQYDYGSPRLPSTGEAFALHYADNLDAKLNQVRGALGNVREGESGWSPYISGLERAVFKPLPTPAAPERSGGEKKGRSAESARGESARSQTPETEPAGQLSLLGGV